MIYLPGMKPTDVTPYVYLKFNKDGLLGFFKFEETLNQTKWENRINKDKIWNLKERYPGATENSSTNYSNKYKVNADVIFAATSEINFNTMMNCIVSEDQNAIGQMVNNGQVKYLYRNDIVYLVTAKWKYFAIRPEGSTEILYVVGE